MTSMKQPDLRLCLLRKAIHSIYSMAVKSITGYMTFCIKKGNPLLRELHYMPKLWKQSHQKRIWFWWGLKSCAIWLLKTAMHMVDCAENYPRSASGWFQICTRWCSQRQRNSACHHQPTYSLRWVRTVSLCAQWRGICCAGIGYAGVTKILFVTFNPASLQNPSMNSSTNLSTALHFGWETLRKLLHIT